MLANTRNSEDNNNIFTENIANNNQVLFH